MTTQFSVLLQSTFSGALGAALILALFIIAVIVLRLIGAWMLRINEVIDRQDQILHELRKMNNRYE
ncbi:hypothetical protein [Echinicola salinicaeni]|uniref:hypothetical protein n=1 Tax=Echinicola salinicaeni TaxID=2762757 RepID=UPI001647B5B7|nr:hypothetical protein [Echinicola salinicaeni]